MGRLLHNGAMLDSLRLWALPYGGDAFLYLTVLAVASFIALLVFRTRMAAPLLRRCIRLSALIALPLTLLSMEGDGQQMGVAVVAIVWCVLVGITCQRTLQQRPAAQK